MDIKTVLVSVAASAAASAVVAPFAASVSLQAVTPGVAEVGHSNITGYSLAGRFGAGASPTLARVQVSDSGSLQGVRSNTASGVSVYGANSAASGLGAGGYFTSASVGGRAMVAEQLSTTGNTVGGLFYNRSTSGGVALWGKHIGASGTTTGVFGEVASNSGTALSGQNTASNNSAVIGTGTDSLKTTGVMPRHDYAGGGTAAMIPIAYGFVAAGGSVFNAGSGNWTVTLAGTGQYDIDIAGFSGSHNSMSPIATAEQASGDEWASITSPATGDFRVNVYNNTGNALTNSGFSFVVFRTGGGTGPNMPSEFENPPGLRKYGSVEGWEKHDPKGFEAFRKRYVAWQMEQMKTVPNPSPVDSGFPKP